MDSPSPHSQESLPSLLRSIADQAQTFVKAEIELLKLESTRTVTRAAVALMVLASSGLLLAIALSLAAAATVMVSGGSAVAALLTAAGVDLTVAIVSSVLVLKWARKPAETVAAEATQLSNLPQHGESLS
jgi:hypothetical protein